MNTVQAGIGRRSVLAHLLVATLLISGCEIKTPMSVEDDGQQRWTAADMVDVAIPDADRNRTDGFYGPFGKVGTIITGPFWTRVFVGDPRKSPTFTIQTAKIQSENIAPFTQRVTYFVDGTLSFEGRDYPIHAEGARSTGRLPFDAASEAIQLGVVDAAHKVKFIVSGGLVQGGKAGDRSIAAGPTASQPSTIANAPATGTVTSSAALKAMCDLPSPVDNAECRGQLTLGMTTNEIIKVLGKPDEVSADGMMLRYGDRYLSLDEKSRLVGIADHTPLGY